MNRDYANATSPQVEPKSDPGGGGEGDVEGDREYTSDLIRHCVDGVDGSVRPGGGSRRHVTMLAKRVLG